MHQRAVNQDFPPASLFPSCFSQCSSLGDSLLISACQAAAGQRRFPVCCSTLGALLCFSLLSVRALLEDYVVAADEHLTEYSHGKFRLGISGRSGFQSDFLLLWRGRN